MGMVLLISPLPKKALLRSVGSNSHFQNLQARTLSWSLGPSPVHGSSCPCSARGMWLLLFQLQVQPLAKLHTHPRADRAGHTGCHRQGAAFNTFPENTPDSQVPSSPSAVQTGGHWWEHTHTHLPDPPSASRAPLPWAPPGTAALGDTQALSHPLSCGHRAPATLGGRGLPAHCEGGTQTPLAPVGDITGQWSSHPPMAPAAPNPFTQHHSSWHLVFAALPRRDSTANL